MAGSEIPPPLGEARSVPISGLGVADVRDPLPSDLRDPSFSTSVRGYDRHAVDRYVERANRLIAELQVSGSPRAAVRHALDRVGEQTSGILQRARDTAEEIIASAREEAEQTTQRAKAEARDILADAGRQASEAESGARAEAEARLRAFEGDIAMVADARERVLAEAKELAARLAQVVAEAEGAEGTEQPAAGPATAGAGDERASESEPAS